MIISGHFVVTIHRRPLKALEAMRARYDEHPLRGEQFLVYKILDAMTSTFFPVLTRIDDDIDEIEERVIDESREEILKRIFSIKRDLVAMRRVVSPEDPDDDRDRVPATDLLDRLLRSELLVPDRPHPELRMVVRRIRNRAAVGLDHHLRHLLPQRPVDVVRRWDAPAGRPSASRPAPLALESPYACAAAGCSTLRGSSVSRAMTRR
jgi:CorA-like Mg2+ transporter protein